MAAEVKYNSGPVVADITSDGYGRGDAVMWVRVGKSERLRPVVLTTDELVLLAYQCLAVLNRRTNG